MRNGNNHRNKGALINIELSKPQPIPVPNLEHTSHLQAPPIDEELEEGEIP